MPDETKGDDAGGNGNGDGGKPESKTGEPKGGKTFTQAEVDKLIGNTRTETRERFEKPDYDEVVAERDKFRTAAETDSEKRDRELAEAQSETQRLTGIVNRQGLDAAVAMYAAQRGAANPSDVLALIDRGGLKSTDGEVTGVEEAVDELLEAKPYLLGGGKKAPSTNPGGKGSEPVILTPDQAAMAHRMSPGKSAAEAEAEYGKGMR